MGLEVKLMQNPMQNFCMECMLFVQHSQVGGCKITCNKCHYYVTYHKGDNHGKSPIAAVNYSPIRCGGILDMNPGTMVKYPCLGEFAYLKMMAVTILREFNNYQKNCDQRETAIGPIRQEMKTSCTCMEYLKCRNLIFIL